MSRPGRRVTRAAAVTVGSVLLLTTTAVGAGGRTAHDDAVTVTEEVVTVAGPGGTVRIQRDPLRFEVRDAASRPVLASVTDEVTAPRLRPPLPDRAPGGSVDLELPPAYAPITFVVGVQTLAQYPGTFWSADILTGVTAGVEHALTAVESVTTTDDGGARLTVATTDADRRATVTVRPDAHRTFAISVRFDDPERVAVTGASFATGPDEAFHGFGGRRNATDQRGQVFTNWLEEFHQFPEPLDRLGAVPLLGDRYQFPTGAQGAYYVQSSFVSSRPYALLLDRDEVSRWRLAADRDDAWQVSVASDALDLVVAPAEPTEAVRRLTAITGRNQLPADWAHGPGVSRAVEPFGAPLGDEAAAYAADVLRDLDEIERLDLPLETFAIEGWPMLERDGSLDTILARMRELGLRPIGYLKPFIGGGRQTERAGLRDEAIDQGLVATTPTGAPFLFGSPVDPDGIAALLDVTDPAAQDWYARRIDDLLDLGFEGFMQDFGEQTFEQMRFADGSTGREMHNRYPVLYHGLTARTIDAYVARNPDRQPWFYVRSGYSGRPGSAAAEQTSWGGDNTADWSRASGIGSVIPDMLNRGIGGAYGYATDIGGYIDTFGRPDAELLRRWSELGALLPVNRLHGSPVNGTHMPWEYGDDVVEAYRDTIELNLRARPLIRSLWREAMETGAPIARPLWWHHPDDPRARAEEQQWLLGPDVLVAPVVERGATTREVHFPTGCWEHPDTELQREGPRTEVVDAPLGWQPYFVRCDTDPFDVAAGPELAPSPDAGAGTSRDVAPPTAGTTPQPGHRDAPPAPRPLPVTGTSLPAVIGVTALLAAQALRRGRR